MRRTSYQLERRARIGRRDGSEWQPFRTRRVLGFEKPYRQKLGKFLFDRGEWLLWTTEQYVRR